jgi:hypothetical protein
VSLNLSCTSGFWVSCCVTSYLTVKNRFTPLIWASQGENESGGGFQSVPSLNLFPTWLGGGGSSEVGDISQVLPVLFYFDGSP